MAITFATTGFGTPNQTFLITVIGQAISARIETDGTGTAITTNVDMYTALNEDPAVTALVTLSDVGGSFPWVFNYGPQAITAPFTPITFGEFLAFNMTPVAQPILTSQLAFIGVRRNPGKLPLLGTCQKFNPKSFIYHMSGGLATGQAKGYLAGQAPLILRETINDFDFELHQVIITYSPPADVTLPAVCSALMLYDAVKQATANIPPLDKFWNGAPGSIYKNGGIVPPLLYPQQTQIRVDVFNLLPDSDLPTTINVYLVGRNRIPC
jgi:hypothetical protein